ncbi:unnamed protein product [Gordionus sp. m RMFG-2023]
MLGLDAGEEMGVTPPWNEWGVGLEQREADSQETTGEEISEEDAWRDLMGVGWEERTGALMRDEEEYSETWDDIFDHLISDS